MRPQQNQKSFDIQAAEEPLSPLSLCPAIQPFDNMPTSASSHKRQKPVSGDSQTQSDSDDVARIGFFGDSVSYKSTFCRTLEGWAQSEVDDHEPTLISEHEGIVYILSRGMIMYQITEFGGEVFEHCIFRDSRPVFDAIMLNFTATESDDIDRLNELLMKLSICFEGIPVMANQTQCKEQDPSQLDAIRHLNFQSFNQTNAVDPESCREALAKVIHLALENKSMNWKTDLMTFIYLQLLVSMKTWISCRKRDIARDI